MDYKNAEEEVERRIEATYSKDIKRFPQWISIDDGLPDEGVQVLAYTKFGEFYTCRRPFIVSINRVRETPMTVPNRVTHWTLLPDPPKENL